MFALAGRRPPEEAGNGFAVGPVRVCPVPFEITVLQQTG
jgi:hypothetical protein